MSTGKRCSDSPSPRGPLASTLLALVVACGGGNDGKPVPGGEKPLPAKGDPKIDAKIEPAPEAKVEPAPDAKVEPAPDAKVEPAPDAKADGGEAKADDGGEKAATDGAKAEGPAADGGDAADGGAPPAADPAALQTEIKTKKTTDERAMAALAELEASGAKLRDVAKAANARGEKLFEEPERAKTFFEWAAAKDPKYPDPLFNLAKQTANAGEVEATREYLKQVKARGGKKLLTQVDFDPMWEIVKDDPEVRKLLEG